MFHGSWCQWLYGDVTLVLKLVRNLVQTLKLHLRRLRCVQLFPLNSFVNHKEFRLGAPRMEHISLLETSKVVPYGNLQRQSLPLIARQHF